MATLLHSVVVQDQLIAADGIQTFDLGVNPLSVLLLRIRPLNNTGTLTDFERFLGLADAMNLVTIRHRGASVLAMRGIELGALSVMRHNWQPWRANTADTTNERIEAVVPIFMGRRPYDSSQCFPATRRGEFEIEIDFDIASGGYDGLRFAIEAIELLGAKPTQFERKVQLTQTFAAIGLNDIDLPLGNMIRGMMLFGTTGAGGAAPAPSFGRMELLADSTGVGIVSMDWETAIGMNGFRASVPAQDHIHTETDTGGPTGVGAHTGESYENHAYVDLDPTNDDEFAIDSSKVSRLQLRVDAETADLVRVIPIEKMLVTSL